MSAFYRCTGLTGDLVIPNSVTSIGEEVFNGCTGLTSLTLGSGVTEIRREAFYNCKGLTSIVCFAPTAPTISNNTFRNVSSGGELYVPIGSDYSSWMNTSSYYLGYYNWTMQFIYTPTECISLSITADDVNGRKTTTMIHWTAVTNGVDLQGNQISSIVITGTTTSSEFPQNTSETDTVERTITFEYLGMTASTIITQGVWVNQQYIIDLNDQWRLSTKVANPDTSTYDGVYESYSNISVDSTAAIMYIDIIGYTDFTLYIRSDAEGSFDYVMVSQLDQTINNDTSYSDTTLVKANTRDNQQSGTAISNYTKVEYPGIDGGEHRITVVYHKDSSAANGSDQGYVLIPNS
jgi:hypothetical protein